MPSESYPRTSGTLGSARGRPYPSVVAAAPSADPPGRPSAPAAPSGERSDAEYREVLDELDAVTREITGARDAEPISPIAETAPTPAEESPPPEPEPESTLQPRGEMLVPSPPSELDGQIGAPSPYLEQRLATAQNVAAELSGEFEQMERRSTELRQTAASLETELRRVTDEVVFLRERDAQVAMAEFGGPPGEDAPEGPPGSPPAPRKGAPPYEWYTVQRYNATIRRAVAGRRRLAFTTVALAVGISIGLLALTLLANEPIPHPWILALLPVVWLIPVPFFIASFRGTQRVLGRQPLEISESG